MKRLLRLIPAILLISLLLPVGAWATDTVVGHNGPGDTAGNGGGNFIVCGPYRANQAGSITQIKGYFSAMSGTASMTCGIYTESGGTYTKIQDTDAIDLNTSMELRTWTLDAPITVDTDTDYYIVYMTPDNYNRKQDAIGSTMVQYKTGLSYTAGTLPSSVSSLAGANGIEILIYGYGAGAFTVTCQDATAKTQTTATLNGNVTANTGTVSAAGFYISTTNNPPTVADTTVSSSDFNGDAEGTGAFTAAASSLTANTTYHCVAFATNGSGTTTSADQPFTTLRNPGTFYISATGRGTKDGSTEAKAMGPTEFNAFTWIADDNILLSNIDGNFNSGLQLGQGGTSGHPITIKNVAGEDVVFYGATAIANTGWTEGYADHDTGNWIPQADTGMYHTTLPFYGIGFFVDGVGVTRAAAETWNGGTCAWIGAELVDADYFANGYDAYWRPATGTTPGDHTLAAIRDWSSGAMTTLTNGILIDPGVNYVTIQKNSTGSIKFQYWDVAIGGFAHDAVTGGYSTIIINGIDFEYCFECVIFMFTTAEDTFQNSRVSYCTMKNCNSFFRSYGSLLCDNIEIDYITATGPGSCDGTYRWFNGAFDFEFIGLNPGSSNSNFHDNSLIGGCIRAFSFHTSHDLATVNTNIYNNYLYRTCFSKAVTKDGFTQYYPGGGNFILIGGGTTSGEYYDNVKIYNNIIVQDTLLPTAAYWSPYYAALWFAPMKDVDDSHHNYFYNNTIIGTQYGVYQEWYGQTSTMFPWSVKNNIFYNPRTHIQLQSGASNYSFSNNDYYGGESGYLFYLGDYKTFNQWTTAASDTNSIAVNPKLLLPGQSAASWYKLQFASPCKDAGADVGLTTDFGGRTYQDGFPMGAWDWVTGDLSAIGGGGLSPGLGLGGGYPGAMRQDLR